MKALAFDAVMLVDIQIDGLIDEEKTAFHGERKLNGL